MVQKDIQREWRSRQIAPRMLLLGCTTCFLLAYQAGVSAGLLERITAGLCWMTLGFIAVMTLGHSISREREEGCWSVLLAYPVPAHLVFLSKVVFNSLLFGLAQLVVVPLFAILSDANWGSQPGALTVVLVLGNLGVTSAGTLLGAVSSGVDRSEGLLAILLLPLLAPVLLAAAEATRLLGIATPSGEWSRWVQLLASFATVYMTVGWVLFEYVVED
jgi:heme exporter protein B